MGGRSGRAIAAGRSQDGSAVWIGPPGADFVESPLGIYVDVTGTAPRVLVYYTEAGGRGVSSASAGRL